MKCKMCGAELKKQGELCNNCMNQIMKEEEAKEDTLKIFDIKRTFVIGYRLSQHIESIIIAVIMSVVLIYSSTKFLFESLAFLALVIIVETLIFLYDRYKINNSKCTFYVTKLIYERIIFFKKREVEISYSDIKQISYNQTRFEKIFKVGTIYIKSNSKNILERNIYIDSVKNVEKVFETIKESLSKE